ncbi:MAG: ATP-binding cassette domain-containing protein, partial [candidate division WOR-3 bacterium]
MNNEIILKTEKLNKIYLRGEEKVWALKDIDLTIKRGEFVSILGPSGSGKTTLLNLLSGFDKPT